MSAEAKGKISVDISRFKQASKEVQDNFKKMGVSSQQTSQKIQQSSTKSGTAVNNLKQKIPPTTQALQQLGQQATQTGQQMTTMGQQANQSSQNMTNSAVAILGLGQSIGGVSDTVFGFSEKLVALEKSSFGLEETTIDLRRAEENYTAAMKEGFASTLDQQRAEEDLILLRQKLIIETKEVKAEQEALNSEFVNFGLNLTQTGIFGFIALKQILPATTQRLIATKLSAISFGKVMKLLRIDLAGVSLAIKGTTLSLVGLRAGIRATLVAIGPIGIAIISLTTAWALWEANVGGIQEKLAELWNMLKNFIPVLQGLELLVNNLFPEAAATSVDEFGNSVNQLNTTVGESTEVMTAYDIIIGQTTGGTDKLNESTIGFGSTMAGVPEWYRSATNSVEKYTKKLTESQKATQDWIKMQEEASRARFLGNDVLRGIDPNSEIDPKTGFIVSSSNKTFADAIRNNPGFVPSGNTSIGDPGKKNRGHSKFRRDTAGGAFRSFFEFGESEKRFGDLNDLASKNLTDLFVNRGTQNLSISKSFRSEVEKTEGLASLFSQLLGVDKTLGNFRNSENLLAQQTSFIDEKIGTTGLSENEIRSFVSKGDSGKQTISNIEQFKMRELAANGVVF